MSRSPTSITEVVERQLCLGCGACAFAQPKEIEMVDDLALGRRPVVAEAPDGEPSTEHALRVCPGIELERNRDTWDSGWIDGLADGWGPVLAVWEGHASDAEIRHAGSSGGVTTALALHCLTHESMVGALHIAARPDVPYLNHTVLSTCRDDMLAAAGSRYAPASPCDSLHRIENADGPCVFIGKPCDVAGAERARQLNPDLDRNLGLTIAIFCAGTPSTRGTLEMIEMMGYPNPDDIRSVRYRGNGWPGTAEVQGEIGGSPEIRHMSYEESWGHVLQKHRPWRCYVCADHTGEFADVAVGDPWYRPVQDGEPGRSLIVARTVRGRRLIENAIQVGALELQQRDASTLVASQPNLIATRAAAWGRMAGGRVVGMTAPHYRDMSMFRVWRQELGAAEKLRSVLSIVRKRLRRRQPRKVRVNR